MPFVVKDVENQYYFVEYYLKEGNNHTIKHYANISSYNYKCLFKKWKEKYN